MDNIVVCRECNMINEGYDEMECIKCGECLGEQREHEHDKNDNCVKSINE